MSSLAFLGRRVWRTAGGHSAMHGPGEPGAARGGSLSRSPAPPGVSERRPGT
jgi:hypothetical protein